MGFRCGNFAKERNFNVEKDFEVSSNGTRSNENVNSAMNVYVLLVFLNIYAMLVTEYNQNNY